MHYSLSNSLGRPYAGILDQDATGYIAAITAEGATVTSAQKYAINDFILAEKSASRWTGLKRFYLPVWGVAAANAICMKSLTSGTFVGGVTHGAGYVQGNGSTGYFDLGVTPSALSLTTASGGFFALATQADSSGAEDQGFIGSIDDAAASSDVLFITKTDSLRLDYAAVGDSVSGTLARAQHIGVLSAMRHGGNRTIRKRATAGVTSVLDVVGADAGTIPTVQNLHAMAFNYVGTATNHTDARLGSFGVTLGLSISDTDAFTLALKTLWESVTSLSLP